MNKFDYLKNSYQKTNKQTKKNIQRWELKAKIWEEIFAPMRLVEE